MSTDRVSFITGRQQETCSIGELVAFLRDYPNVSNVFIVRRLVSYITDMQFECIAHKSNYEIAARERCEAQQALGDSHNRIMVLENECDDLTGENRTLKGKVEDLENVIEYMEHGNKLVEPRGKVTP